MASYRNIKNVSVSPDGVEANADALGEVFTDGSSFPDGFEEQLDALADGRSLSAGKTAAYVLRILNAAEAVVTDLQTAEEEGSDRYFHLYNRSNTEVAVVGPAKVTGCDERPPGSGAQRGSVLVGFNVAGDVSRDFLEIRPIT